MMSGQPVLKETKKVVARRLVPRLNEWFVDFNSCVHCGELFHDE
jgi:hypothetical protein